MPIVYPARNQMERICMTIRCLCAFYRYCLLVPYSGSTAEEGRQKYGYKLEEPNIQK